MHITLLFTSESAGCLQVCQAGCSWAHQLVPYSLTPEAHILHREYSLQTPEELLSYCYGSLPSLTIMQCKKINQGCATGYHEPQ